MMETSREKYVSPVRPFKEDTMKTVKLKAEWVPMHTDGKHKEFGQYCNCGCFAYWKSYKYCNECGAKIIWVEKEKKKTKYRCEVVRPDACKVCKHQETGRMEFCPIRIGRCAWYVDAPGVEKEEKQEGRTFSFNSNHCSSCKYFKEVRTWYECRKNAPLGTDDSGENYVPRFPHVYLCSWCGEWASR